MISFSKWKKYAVLNLMQDYTLKNVSQFAMPVLCVAIPRGYEGTYSTHFELGVTSFLTWAR